MTWLTQSVAWLALAALLLDASLPCVATADPEPAPLASEARTATEPAPPVVLSVCRCGCCDSQPVQTVVGLGQPAAPQRVCALLESSGHPPAPAPTWPAIAEVALDLDTPPRLTS